MPKIIATLQRCPVCTGAGRIWRPEAEVFTMCVRCGGAGLAVAKEPTRPSMGQALAEAHAEVRAAHRALNRSSVDARTECVVALREARTRTYRLLEANAAHLLDWCHDFEVCPVCLKEVDAPR